MPHPHDQRYPPIADYALIGDSRTAALVSRDGSIDWLCMPDFDSPSMFARLLDWERGGHWRIAPEAPYESGRRYIDDTNVLETVFTTADGEAVLIDFMPAQDEDGKRRELQPLRSVVRIVEGRRGAVRMRFDYAPRPGYGMRPLRVVAHGGWEVTATGGPHVTHLRSDVRLDIGQRDARGSFVARAGERTAFSLAYAHGQPAVIVGERYEERMLEATLDYWRRWSSRCSYSGPYREQVMRSALTLKLLAYAPSGAIVAAPTTSLPEHIGGERNYDYRYCWLRDAAFTVDSLLSIGYADEAHAFVNWLMHATRTTAPVLRPLYTLYGETNIAERPLAHFEGYRQSTPVRTGNAAMSQEQFDVYGELVAAFHAYMRHAGRDADHGEARLIARVADHVVDVWREPDNGIWEPRREPRHYTHSKVMLWHALRSAIELADEGRTDGNVAVWQRTAAEIRREVLARGFNAEIGAFTQTLDGENLDASVLTMSLVGFIEPDDPRMLGTIDAVRARLEHNGFVRRYEGFDDGLAGEEGAFITCNFWLVAALAYAGRIDDARTVFERSLRAANDVGLMAEEVDTRTGEALGNFPQGLSHIELIDAALAIAAADRGEIRARVHTVAK